MADILPHEDRQNKRAIREMVRDAFDRLGGVDWLVTFAMRSDENARVFINVIAKLIPLEVTGKDGEAIQIVVNTYQAKGDVTDVEILPATDPEPEVRLIQ